MLNTHSHQSEYAIFYSTEFTLLFSLFGGSLLDLGRFRLMREEKKKRDSFLMRNVSAA